MTTTQKSEARRGPGSTCVLVIEDEPAIRMLLTEYLEDAGFVVETAVNGKEGCLCLHSSLPDVVILDLMMPVMDGWSFLEYCRQSDDYAHLPVIVTSAAMEGRKVVEKYDIAAYYDKPFDLDELLIGLDAATR